MTDEELKAAVDAEKKTWREAQKEAWRKKQKQEPPLDKRNFGLSSEAWRQSKGNSQRNHRYLITAGR